MQLFRDVIDECGFIDLGFIGSQFTWQKHYLDGHSIWERLDRGLANNDCFMQFAGTKIHHLSSNASNHCPLWIIPDGLEISSITKPFRFAKMWLSDRGCSNVVEAVQTSHEEANPSIKVLKKIKKNVGKNSKNGTVSILGMWEGSLKKREKC